MRKVLVLLIFAMFPLTASASFESMLNLCRNIQQVSKFISSATIVNWPSPPGGVVIGLFQQTSVMVEFCEYVLQVSELNNEKGFFYTKNYLNTLTGKKWDDHFYFLDTTWDFASTMYDFENGESRAKLSIENLSQNRAISSYAREAMEYSERNFNKEEASTEGQKDRQLLIDTFARTAQKRALLKEMINCPEVEKNDIPKNLIKEYIQNQEIEDVSKEDTNFYLDRLLDMGAQFLNSIGEQYLYEGNLQHLKSQGVSYSYTGTRTFTEDTFQPTGELLKNGKPKVKKVKMKRTYETYEAHTDRKMFAEVIEKFNERWVEWVKAEFQRATNAAQNEVIAGSDPLFLVTKKFQNYNYECRAVKLMVGYDKQSADYSKVLSERTDQCFVSIQINQKKAESLFVYFLNEYEKSLFKMKQAQTKNWQIDSRYLGLSYKASMNGKRGDEGIFYNDVKCERNLTSVEMDYLKSQQSKTNLEYKEQIAKEMYKKTTRISDKKMSEAQAAKEAQQRKELIDKKVEHERELMKTPQEMNPVRSGM